MAHPPSPDSRLARLPLSTFAMVMGLGGLANCWALATPLLGLPARAAPLMLGLASALFAALLGLQLARLLRHRQALAAEFADPMKASFFATLSIAAIVLATGWRALAPQLAEALWLAGSALHLLLALLLIRRWVLQAQDERVMTPAWFIPVVGNILIPVAGVPLGYPGWSAFFFSVGLMLWLAFFVIALHRVLFMPAMSARSLPTLFILLAPPSIGFLACLALDSGQISPLARTLFHLSLFMALLLASLLPRLLRGRFYLSWWALTFPSCGWAMALLLYAQRQPEPGAWLLLAGAAVLAVSALVLAIAALTLRHFWTGQWAREDAAPAAELPPPPSRSPA